MNRRTLPKAIEQAVSKSVPAREAPLLSGQLERISGVPLVQRHAVLTRLHAMQGDGYAYVIHPNDQLWVEEQLRGAKV
jgi:hypothetical protein